MASHSAELGRAPARPGRTTLAIVGMAIVAGAGLVWCSFNSRPRGRAPSAAQAMAPPAEIAELRRDIEALKRDSRTVRMPAPEPAPMVDATPSATVSSAPSGPPLDIASARAERAARVAAAKERMEFEIASQARTRAVEREVGEQLRVVYDTAEFEGTHFESLECYATLCRVKSRHDSREHMLTFARNAAKYPPFDTEVFYSYGEGETPVSTFYAAREGASLPRDF